MTEFEAAPPGVRRIRLGKSVLELPPVGEEDPEVLANTCLSLRLFLEHGYHGYDAKAPSDSAGFSEFSGLMRASKMPPEDLLAHYWPVNRIVCGGKRYIALVPMLFNIRLVIGKELWSYERAWCYDKSEIERAIQQFLIWDPEVTEMPDGWMKDVNTGRYRPGGDASQERAHW